MKKFQIWLLATLASLTSLAQEKSADIDINVSKDGNSFWSTPWVWIIGAAIFILLLVALMRGGSKEAS